MINCTVSGTYHLSPHEKASIQVMRGKMNMSINHIALTLSRSTRTIHSYLKTAKMIGICDNRGKEQFVHQIRKNAFIDRYPAIRNAMNIWIAGKAPNLMEALAMTIKGFAGQSKELYLKHQRDYDKMIHDKTIQEGQDIQEVGVNQDIQDSAVNQEGGEGKNSQSPDEGEGEEEDPA